MRNKFSIANYLKIIIGRPLFLTKLQKLKVELAGRIWCPVLESEFFLDLLVVCINMVLKVQVMVLATSSSKYAEANPLKEIQIFTRKKHSPAYNSLRTVFLVLIRDRV